MKNKAGFGSQSTSRSQALAMNKPPVVDVKSLVKENMGQTRPVLLYKLKLLLLRSPKYKELN